MNDVHKSAPASEVHRDNSFQSKTAGTNDSDLWVRLVVIAAITTTAATTSNAAPERNAVV